MTLLACNGDCVAQSPASFRNDFLPGIVRELPAVPG